MRESVARADGADCTQVDNNEYFIRDRAEYLAALVELQECIERADTLLMLMREYDLVLAGAKRV
jgi:hypothetical protein